MAQATIHHRALSYWSKGPLTMSKKSTQNRKSLVRSIYDLSTPLLDKYYREMRKKVRFPRYYKRALNW